MVAMELCEPGSREPATELAARTMKLCYERGLVTMKAGIWNNVIRFLAPLCITDAQLEEGLQILSGAMADAAG